MARLSTSEPFVGRSAPLFVRQSSRGMVTSHDPSGNHPHLLVFCPTLDTEGCLSYLDRVDSEREERERLQAEVIVLIAGEETLPGDLSFPVVMQAEDLFVQYGLVDEEGQPHAGLVGVGRYGTVESHAAAPTPLDFPDIQAALTRLGSAEAECPECGVAETLWEASQE